jgi:flagellin
MHTAAKAVVQRADRKVLKSFDRGSENQLTAPTVFDFGAKNPAIPPDFVSPGVNIMSLTINTNIASIDAQRNLSASQNSLSTSMQRLSSGLRINSAKDDAAGLSIAERMNAQVRGMNVAVRNSNDGISLAQTADGALAQVSNSLQRMRELAVQARNSTNSSSDKDSLNKEFGQLQAEITRVLGGTTFNGKHMLGADATTLNFQVGANTTADDTVSIKTVNMVTDSTMATVTQSTQSSIDSTNDSTAIGNVIDNIDKAIDDVNDTRATFGATESRFDSIISNLQSSVENQTAARSRIMDADFASETANMSRANVLQQAGTAMIAQANQQPQQVLTLLR